MQLSTQAIHLMVAVGCVLAGVGDRAAHHRDRGKPGYRVTETGAIKVAVHAVGAGALSAHGELRPAGFVDDVEVGLLTRAFESPGPTGRRDNHPLTRPRHRKASVRACICMSRSPASEEMGVWASWLSILLRMPRYINEALPKTVVSSVLALATLSARLWLGDGGKQRVPPLFNPDFAGCARQRSSQLS